MRRSVFDFLHISFYKGTDLGKTRCAKVVKYSDCFIVFPTSTSVVFNKTRPRSFAIWTLLMKTLLFLEGLLSLVLRIEKVGT